MLLLLHGAAVWLLLPDTFSGDVPFQTAFGALRDGGGDGVAIILFSVLRALFSGRSPLCVQIRL
jgi:hypothetical protein